VTCFHPGPSPDELTDRLPHAAGARVTAVEIDELGPEVTAARIELATAAGTGHVTARLVDGLVIAVTMAAPIRVADAVMDRLAVPAGTDQAGPMPEQTARDLPPGQRPRYEPRNLAFAAGLAGWELGGNFLQNAITSTSVIFSFRVSRSCDLRHRVADTVVDAMSAA
jgi:Domain of unknown function (DUF151)